MADLLVLPLNSGGTATSDLSVQSYFAEYSGVSLYYSITVISPLTLVDNGVPLSHAILRFCSLCLLFLRVNLHHPLVQDLKELHKHNSSACWSKSCQAIAVITGITITTICCPVGAVCIISIKGPPLCSVEGVDRLWAARQWLTESGSFAEELCKTECILNVSRAMRHCVCQGGGLYPSHAQLTDDGF